MAKPRKSNFSITLRQVVYATALSVAIFLLLFFVRNAGNRLSLRSDMFDYEHIDPSVLSAAVSAALSTPALEYAVASDTPQYVVLSFDGGKSSDMLDETLAFQKEMAGKNKLLYFTYFINAAYFLSNHKKALYQAPYHKPGVSNIGFSDSVPDITRRVRTFNEAVKRGNEVGSHTVGHFVGTSWTYQDWKQEFNSFFAILFGVQQNMLPLAVEPWLIAPKQIKGFRAPTLGVNENMYQVLGDFSFRYDSSGIGPAGNWPVKDAYGIWRIPLGIIHVGPHKNPVLAMDYNLWVYQSKARNTVKKGTALWLRYFGEVLKAYRNYFYGNYNGSRAPIVIGNHFTKYNDGLYWEAMKAFAEEVCGKPYVRCTTFSKFVDYLDTKGPPLGRYR